MFLPSLNKWSTKTRCLHKENSDVPRTALLCWNDGDT